MTEHRINLDLLAKKRDGTGHSIFSPSSAHMWLECSGSLIPNVLAPDIAGIDAAVGTVAHSVTEEWLRTERRPVHLLGKKQFILNDGPELGHLVTIDEEMLSWVEESVDRADWIPGERFIEKKVKFSHLTPIPNQGGTLDLSITQPSRWYTIDHKYGSSPSNRVEAKENPQIMLYGIGLGVFLTGGFDRNDDRLPNDWVFQINQPRLNNFDEWSCGLGTMLDFQEYVRERAAAAWRLDAPRTPGIKQCRFCAVRATCPANAKLQEDLLSSVFQDETIQTAEQMQNFVERLDDSGDPFKLQMATVAELTTAQMARLLPFRALADAWWKALEAELNRRAADGQKIPGLKPVEARTRRAWKNQFAAQQLLAAEGFERDAYIKESMVSPAEAERLLVAHGRKRAELPKLLADVVYKPPGKVILVPLSDKRKEVEDLGAYAFEINEDSESSETGEP